MVLVVWEKEVGKDKEEVEEEVQGSRRRRVRGRGARLQQIRVLFLTLHRPPLHLNLKRSCLLQMMTGSPTTLSDGCITCAKQR